ncbi:S-layer homology domain-containing protein [Metasolibacillus meyeri]|uniref:S-layer homology domain-containing protein n=1 Tax=Metasolibacillus meyeri TaxID=1071052 RepID=UPI000D2F72B1|nr:S-layer homology domain-containing protein [Metasolibacillus meyeri]
MNQYKRVRQFLAIMLSVVMILSMMPPMATVKAASPTAIKVTQIAAAQNNSIALKSDGTVIVWGNNVTSWAKPPEELKDVVEIYAKDTVFLARKSNGTLIAWGSNNVGETTIPAGLNKVISMASAGKHTLAVAENSMLAGTGTVIGWGLNGNGQSTVPDAAKSGVAKVATGTYYSMALKFNGTVVDWGSNGSGATSKPANLSNVVAIDAGSMYALALKSDGTVVAWGAEHGGNGILNVPAGLNNVTAISAGYTHALALKSDGTVVAWGDNRDGKATPPAGLNDVIAVSAGVNHSLALKRDGTVVSWGSQTSVPGDNHLNSLTLEEGELLPVFSSADTSYHSDIAPMTSTVRIKAELKNTAYSALYINDQLQKSGSTVAVSVPTTGTEIKIRVEPYMQPAKTYTLTISRDRQSPNITFSPNGNAEPLRGINTLVQVTDATSGVNPSTLEYAWTQTATAPIAGWAPFSLLPSTSISQFTHAGADGIWYLHIRAKDYAGNSANATSEPFLIDNTPPVVSITMQTADYDDYLNDTWTNKDVVVTVEATDAQSGMATLQYTLDGGKTWMNYLDPIPLTEGIHTVIVQAVDVVGNVKLDSRTVKISSGDLKLTPLMVKIPGGGDYKSGEWTNQSVQASATADTGAIAITSFTQSINGEPATLYTPGMSTIFFQEGINSFEFNVTDALANSVNALFTINIDKTAPTASFNPNGDEFAIRGTSVMATVADSGGSGLIESTLEYVWTQSTDQPTIGWLPFNNGSELTKEGVDGIWYLHIQGRDTAGNTMHAVSNRFVINNPSQDSTISPSTVSFDKNIALQTDIELALSLNGNTLTNISNGTDILVPDTDYVVLGNTVTIQKSYLATQPMGTINLVFSFSAGVEQTLTITIEDTTIVPASNANLSVLTVGGSTISGFDSNVTTYHVELASDILIGSPAATVYAIADDAKASVTITQAPTLPGSAIVKVVAEDKATVKIYTIHFTRSETFTPVTKISITGGQAVTTKNGTLQLASNIMPVNASNKAVNWSIISGGSYATLSNTGLLTALSNGTVTIRATAQDGSGIYAEAKITISGQQNSFDNIESSGSDDSYTSDTQKPTILAEKQPNMPNVEKKSIVGTVKNSILSAKITEQMMKDAIKAAQDAAKKSDRSDGIAVEFNITSKDSYSSLNILVDAGAIDQLKEASVKFIKIGSTVLDITMDTNAIAEIDKQSTGAVTVSAKAVTKLFTETQKLIGSRPAFNITIGYQKNSKPTYITNFGKGTITLGLAYKASEKENTGNLFGVYVDKNGKPQLLTNSSYGNGRLIFNRNSLSIYGVGYKTTTPVFTDTTKHWAKDNIDFVVSRNLISGTSTTTFAPSTAITRADLLMALGKIADVKVTDYKMSSFTDIKATNPAMPYIEWAVENKIVQGIGNGKFDPTRSITRAEIAVIMQNYAKAINYKLPVSVQAVTFSDNEKIVDSTKDAIKTIQQAGIMRSKENNTFAPQTVTTRAEASTFLRRLMELVIDENTARGWTQNDAGQWQYIDENGKAVIGWLISENNKYHHYFTKDGIMVSNKWFQINTKWFYFYADGSLAKNAKIVNYEVDENGVRK